MGGMIVGTLLLLTLCIIVAIGYKEVPSWVYYLLFVLPGLVITIIPPFIGAIIGIPMVILGVWCAEKHEVHCEKKNKKESLDRENAMLLNAFLKEKGASFLNNVLTEDTEEQQEGQQEETQETTDATESDDIQTPMDKFVENNEKLNKYGITKENIVFYVKAFAYLGLFIAFCYCMASLFV